METSVDKPQGQAGFSQMNSFNRSDLYSFNIDDVAPRKSKGPWFLYGIIVYFILLTVVNAFLLFKGDGDVGPAGPPGLTGQHGERGPQGPPGEQGAPGPSGYGGVGPACPEGTQEPPGEQGDSGPSGDGDVGPAGPRGPTGQNGERCLQGPPGEPGPPGPSGARGPPGFNGTIGHVGPHGKDGDKGTKGDTGSLGPSGPTGPQGRPGDRGPPGPKGNTGVDGGEIVRVSGWGGYSGRIEVKRGGSWGTVCDDDFDRNDGTVICKMLGYQRATRVYASPGGSGYIWLDNLQCTGSEWNIFDCPHRGIGVHDCSHGEDAGVDCA